MRTATYQAKSVSRRFLFLLSFSKLIICIESELFIYFINVYYHFREMNIILKKSEDNFNAGRLLKKEGFYASSIHCFYYSTVQLMINILINYDNMTEKDIEQKSIESKRGFHNWIINNIYNKFTNEKDQIKFNNEIHKLKNKRVIADYKNKEITSEDSISSESTSEKVIDLLLKLT